MKSFKAPRKFSDIVPDICSALDLEEAYRQHRAFRIWDSIVGDAISRVTRVDNFIKGTLYIRVHNPSWRNELSMRKRSIISRLNEALGSEMVRDIVFR
ncbi:hypothetical protein CHL67_00020 [Prosthecochloris sp. GSB1]|uniref:DUF721 domain-containing protein n=1 Tax=Prosthecochloris sp. GSB1 TaxID=281093 RepID=UPI000B8CBA56|nr:DUF721 domain-containing protein [Prosthecochloris sp. GSB1]ASQ89538.1 hypothetical protein CHL67_00020 [Prosthecochloris sp. GSB1]